MYTTVKASAIGWLVLLSMVRVWGQQQDFLVHLDSYTTENGLSSNHVYNCFQDSRGILWMVRDGGIDRFDGEEFKAFNQVELKNVNNMEILMEDEDHDLWIRRHDKTFVYLNIFTEKIRTSEEKFGPTFPRYVNWAVKGINGSYLLQDEGSQILRYIPGQSPTLYYATPGKIVSPLVEYPNGTAWSECNFNHQGGELIATRQDGSEIIKIPYHTDHIYAKGIWGHDTIHYITKDSFYLANFKGIVWQQSLKSIFPNYVFTDPYQNGRFPNIVVEQDRDLVWVYYPYQILVFDKSLRLLYALESKKYFVETTNVYCIFHDNQNHTWLCTFDGLHNVTFKSNPFRQFLSQDPTDIAYNPKSIRKMCKVPDGSIYVIASNDMYRITPTGEVQHRLSLPDLAALEVDDTGRLWFTNNKLYSYQTNSGKLETHAKIDFGNWLMKKIDRRMWYSYPLSYIDLDKQEFTVKNYPPLMEGDRMDVYDILPKNDHEYYVGTNSGLFIFDETTGSPTKHYWDGAAGATYFPASNIRHIHQDKSGDLWLATTEGLLNWNPKTEKYQLFKKEDGGRLNCNAVLEDDFGYLWVSSDFGLMQFDKKQKKVVRTYLVTDGLPSDEFNRLAYFQDKETGHMYLGGLNGLVKFHPRDFLPDTTLKHQSNLVLTECLLFSGQTNQEEDIRASVLENNRITISPGDLFLRIKFALTDFTRSKEIVYSYVIEGYNSNWHQGTENELLISGLPYGNYTLRVKALAANGFPSNYEMQIQIRVKPPFYLQAWFLVLMALLAILVVIWYTRRRTQLLRERTVMLEGMVKERTQVIESQRESLKELYDFKSRLYANITHEFRTPLTLIIGPARKAMKQAEATQNPEIQQNLNNIIQNSEQLLGLVNQMLDLNKLESRAMKPEFYQSDIIVFLYQIVERFQHYAASLSIRLSFQSQAARLVMDFDPEIIEKILNNLLSNALKFTPTQGEIVVTATALDQQLQVTVKDTGRGIEASKLPYIFDRFYQADNSATRHSEGTGIGLALVKELMELLEGKIEVESTPGKETLFTLQLPIRNLSPQKTGAVLPGAVLSGHLLPVQSMPTLPLGDEAEQRPCIMVIEDNVAVANYITACLIDFYEVQTFNDSKKGLEAVLERLPDLVVSDLMMPEMDGYELCSILKQDERTSHIPVVFLSAVTEQAERLKRINAGADAYISKPFQEEELTAVVAGLLAARERLRSKYLAQLSSDEINTEVAGEPLSPIELDFLSRVKAAVLTNLSHEDYDGRALARETGFSDAQFHRKLSALTGLSAGRYIHQVRLGVACELLQRKELSISEVAYQTGFSDPAYFTRLFTKTFGKSPRAYRTGE